jgi:hypothetical protein
VTIALLLMNFLLGHIHSLERSYKMTRLALGQKMTLKFNVELLNFAYVCYNWLEICYHLCMACLHIYTQQHLGQDLYED